MNDNERHLSRSLKYEEKRRLQLQNELKEERNKVNELKTALADILHCPFNIEEATVPKAGIEAAPEQVVLNVSMGYLRRVRALELIEKHGGLNPRGWKRR